MKAYSIDLRERVLADCDAGRGTHEVALKYRVSESWVRRLKQQRRETGQIAARQGAPPGPRVLVNHYAELTELVRQQPDITLREMRDRLGIKVGLATLHRALRTLQLTFKKKSSGRPSRIGPTSRSVGLGGKPR